MFGRMKGLGIVFWGPFSHTGGSNLMESNEIIYTTVENQIEKLKGQGLIIQDETFAKSALRLYGYSNLIKSYRRPYTISDGSKITYRSGITFEQILSLYHLDNRLRSAVMSAMLDLEEHVKEAAADVVANSFGICQDQYLAFQNYRNKRRRRPQFTLSRILEKMREALETDKNPIFHYSRRYGTVPPWILFKSIYFSTIVNFINLFKPREQQLMASRLYPSVNADFRSLLMMDALFVCLEYRNLAAHGGRIYNHNCEIVVRSSASGTLNLRGFSKLLAVLHKLDYQSPYKHLEYELNNQINRHCVSFPEDTTYLGEVLNLDIVSKNIVWLTEKSKKYHSRQHCSGNMHAQEAEESKAKELGYTPCKRCYSSNKNN